MHIKNKSFCSFFVLRTVKAMNCFPELPPIRRCHSYSITGKYMYRCVKCFYVISRHSKSIDVSKVVCGYCKGSFELLLHNPKDPKTPKTPKKPNAFALFVKENYSSVKNSGFNSHREAMKQLGEQFRKLRFPDDEEGKENIPFDHPEIGQSCSDVHF